jgi:hypothetical protein
VVGLSLVEQGAHAAEKVELTRLVDSPTAGLVERGRLAVDLRLFPEGGVLGQLQAGALKRLSIGLSFGGERIIGDRRIDWYPRVEVGVRYRLVEESRPWPALVLGYETQGYGRYLKGRYQVKSKGFFASLSKNYLSALGQFGVHGGANLSREDGDDGDLSGWVGLDKSLNQEVGLLVEYDLGFNDNGRAALGTGKGYLNAGAHWAVAPPLKIAFFLKNLLGNGQGNPRPSRELAVVYSEEF